MESATNPGDDTPIEVTFEQTFSDRLAAERLFYRSTVLWKIDKVAALLLAVVGVVSVSLQGVHWWNLLWFVLAVAEWFNAWSIRPLVVLYAFKTDPRFREIYHLAFDREGFHFRTASLDSRLKWTFYTRWLENDRLFLLVYGPRTYSVVPKRAFRNPDDVARFRKLVSEAGLGR